MTFFTVFGHMGSLLYLVCDRQKKRIQDRMKGLPGNTENKNKEQCIAIKYENIASEKKCM